MALTVDEQAAVDRLAEYNANTYDAGTNPHGMGGQGYKTQIPAALNDVSTAAEAAARETSDSADSATAAASAAADALSHKNNAATSASSAASSATAAAAARDIAVAAAAAVTQINNLTAITNPTTDNDSADTAGYGLEFAVGSFWINTVSEEVYRCVDDSVGAAVWVQTTLTLDELGGMATQNPNNVAITGGTVYDTKSRSYGLCGFLIPGTLTNGTHPIRWYAETNTRISKMKIKTADGTVDVIQSVNGSNNIGFGATPSDTVSVDETLTEYDVNEGGNAYIDLSAGDYIEIQKSSASTDAADLFVSFYAEINR